MKQEKEQIRAKQKEENRTRVEEKGTSYGEVEEEERREGRGGASLREVKENTRRERSLRRT